MQALANLSLNNWAAVAKTFAAQSAQTGSDPTVWNEKTYTFGAAYKRLTYRVSPSNSSRQTDKVFLELRHPKVQTINSVDTVTSTGIAKIELTIPSNFVDADIQDLYAFISNALANATIKAAIVAKEPIL